MKTDIETLTADQSTPTDVLAGATRVDLVRTVEGYHVEVETAKTGVVFPSLTHAQVWVDTLVNVGYIKLPIQVMHVDRRPWAGES